MTWDTDMHDPNQKLLRVYLNRTAPSCQGTQRHKTAMGYFVFPEPTCEAEGKPHAPPRPSTYSSRYSSESLKIQAFKNSSYDWRVCGLSLSTGSFRGKVYLSVNRGYCAAICTRTTWVLLCTVQQTGLQKVGSSWLVGGGGVRRCFLLLNKLRPAHSSALLKVA